MSQDSLDQPAPCCRPGIGDEGVDGFGIRRQPEHVEVESSHECAGVGCGREVQSGLGQASADEGIDRVVGGGDFRRSPIRQRLERPVRGAWGRVVGRAGEAGSLVDPGAEQCDLAGGESRPLGGHLRVGVETGDVFQQRAVGAPAGSDRFLFAVASGNRYPGPIEPVVAFLSLGTVTRIAVSSEDRADVGVEVDGSLDRRRQPGRGRVAAGVGQCEHRGGECQAADRAAGAAGS